MYVYRYRSTPPNPPPPKKTNHKQTTKKTKAPELLLGHAHYDYAVDLWGVGCVLAGLLFRREPFFRGWDDRSGGRSAGLAVCCFVDQSISRWPLVTLRTPAHSLQPPHLYSYTYNPPYTHNKNTIKCYDRRDQLRRIAMVLGSEGLLAVAAKYEITLDRAFRYSNEGGRCHVVTHLLYIVHVVYLRNPGYGHFQPPPFPIHTPNIHNHTNQYPPPPPQPNNTGRNSPRRRPRRKNTAAQGSGRQAATTPGRGRGCPSPGPAMSTTTRPPPSVRLTPSTCCPGC